MQERIKELIRTFPKQVVEAIKKSKIHIEDKERIENIVLLGMGGSAVAGNILKNIVDIKIPFIINKNYEIPAIINSKTLVFAVSYSGNTEETITAMQYARRKNAQLIAMTCNGKISEIARKYNLPLINMPEGLVPRFTIIFQIFALLHTLHTLNIIKLNKEDIEEAIKVLKKDYSNTAEQLAKKLKDKIVLIYSSPKLEGVGLYWKQAFNENAKIPAFNSTFPELNHNELESYSKKLENFYVIILRDENENLRIDKRIDLSKEIIKTSKVQISEIIIKGNSCFGKICSAIVLGASVSAELADQTDVDATEVNVIEQFKKDLSS